METDTLRIIVSRAITTPEDMPALRADAWAAANRLASERGLLAANLTLVDKKHWHEARACEWVGNAFADLPLADYDVYVYCFEAEGKSVS